MLSSCEFIRQSLELHLFFARIMKEHAFFLQVGFTPRDTGFVAQANQLRMEFDKLLWDVVNLANGVISTNIIQSGEIVTQYTLKAEEASSFFTGVIIPTNITQAEMQLMGSKCSLDNPRLEQTIYLLNQKAIDLITLLIEFKAHILTNVLACEMFTVNYPLLIDHIMREARLYLNMVTRLQSKEEINIEKEIYGQELFWNKIMAEHSKFIRGLLDPTENDLINLANNFANEFDELTLEVIEAIDKSLPIDKVTAESLQATEKIRNFNAQGTQGLLDCKIRSILLPLLGDHVLRESNHFIRLLKRFQR
jgi:hypothetical protein